MPQINDMGPTALLPSETVVQSGNNRFCSRFISLTISKGILLLSNNRIILLVQNYKMKLVLLSSSLLSLSHILSLHNIFFVRSGLIMLIIIIIINVVVIIIIIIMDTNIIIGMSGKYVLSHQQIFTLLQYHTVLSIVVCLSNQTISALGAVIARGKQKQG